MTYSNSSDNFTFNLETHRLLLANPRLMDPNFYRTVVLIVEKDTADNSHFGLVLNRPLDLNLRDTCQMPGKLGNLNIFNGGPVDLQRLFWLHTLGDIIPGSKEVIPGLFVGGNDFEPLVKAVENGLDIKGKVRFYLGYSGWDESQLENEISQGAWAPMAAIDPASLLELEGDEMWQTYVNTLGGIYKSWKLIPPHSMLN